jgi:hypothetical protein
MGCAAKTAGHDCAGEVGPGTVARVCRELQRQFFGPPDLDRGHVPRWSSRRANGIRPTKATAES